MKKVVLSIEGMTCAACSSGLEKYLNKQEGIEQASVNLVMNNASIEYNEKVLNITDLEKFIKDAGFKSLGIDKFGFEQKKDIEEKNRLIILCVLSVLIIYISMSHMVGLPVLPYLNMIKYPLNYAFCLFLLTSAVIAFSINILKKGIKNLINKIPNMDTLVTIGVIASYIYSIFGTIMIINGRGEYAERLYYESAALVLFFVQIGNYIENKNKDKTIEALKSLVTITPKHATIIKEGAGWEVTIDEIKKGDIVFCRPGEKIAVDGTIIDGITHIDESFITGESIPCKKKCGDKVLAGSVNYEGTITYKAEKIGKESEVSEIVKLVYESTNTKAPIARIADVLSRYFIPVVLFGALLSFIVWCLISSDISFALNIFVSVLVVACPCSLGLATPLAIVIGSGLCSIKGILVKSSEILENAHKVKTVVFDKTGTLTKGILNISTMINYSYIDENEIIKYAASIENNSEHPMGKALVEYANENNIQLQKVSEFKSIPGLGVYGKINGDEYYIGNRKLMTDHSVLIEYDTDEYELENQGDSVLFISKNHELIALVGVRDVVRYNAKLVVDKLKKQNKNVVMLTGDNEKTARFIANEIGIENVISNVNPKEKADRIKDLQKEGLVLMCGDGINDSVSLVKADIGVSLSNGTDVALDSSQVILMNNNIGRIVDLINISRRTINNIRQNLFWAFFYNICMIPIAMGVLSGWGILLNPMIAALAMTLSSLTVVLNALRLRRIL